MSETMISAAAVSELRRETGTGMMDCKKALQEAGGDKEKAIDLLRKKGMATAEKRSARAANEGLVITKSSADGSIAALVEINSETDFVARNDEFKQFGNDIANLVLDWSDADGKSIEDLKQQQLSGKAIDAILTGLIGKIGEKLDVSRFARIDSKGGYVGSYIHSDSKLGVLVELSGITDGDDAKSLGRDLAMQIAASSPHVVSREDMPQDKIDAEHKIEEERALAEGKPEKAVPNIAKGRVNKWLAGVVLLEQPFVKDPKTRVSDLVAEVSKKTGNTIEVKSFTRFRIGE